MKKLLALLAVVLCVVSCQTEPEGLDVNVGGEIDAIVNVTIPEAETRATNSGIGVFNNGVLENNAATMRYILQVYYKTVENGVEKYKASAERKVEYSDGKSVAFDVRLVPQRDYKFVVWADVVASEADVDNHYITENLESITLNPNDTWVAMDESRDAFTATELIEDYNGAMSIDMSLYRPFAKLRVVTTDMEALSNIKITPSKATATYTTSHRVAFNALTGKAANASLEAKTHTYTITTYANEWDNNVSKGTMTIFSDYFFAESDIVKFNLDVYDQNDDLIKSNAFQTDINVKRNYLTTIKGNILTDGKNFTVTIDDNFADEETYTCIDNGAQLIKAMKTSGQYIINRDINVNENDIALASTLSATRANITSVIDLNGKTITVDNKSNSALVSLANGDTLVFAGEGEIIATANNNAKLVEGGNTYVTEANVENDVVEAEDTDATLAYVLANGGTVTLKENVTAANTLAVTTTNPVVINGNGKTITYTGSARAFTVEYTDNVKTANVTLNNLTFVNTASYCQRGINFNVAGKLTLNNVKVSETGTAATYAINLPGSSDNAVVEINNSYFRGNIALNVWGASMTVAATNTEFVSYDGVEAENYAAISVNNDGAGNAAEGTNVNITGGRIVALDEDGNNSYAVRNSTMTGVVTISESTEVIGTISNPVAAIIYEGYNEFYSTTTLKAAIDKAIETNGSVRLLCDNEVNETLEIATDKTLTLDLNGKTVTFTGNRGFRIMNPGSNVTIKNGKIVSNATAGRCVETRNGNQTLTLENVTLEATKLGGLNTQPLTVGGSGNNIVVNINNSTLNAGTIGYGITTFNPVELNINNSTVSGYAALYIKGEVSSLGSAGSKINVTNGSVLIGNNNTGAHETNTFSTIMFEDNNVTLNIDETCTVEASTVNSNKQYILFFNNGVENNNVTIAANNVVLEGEPCEYLIGATGNTVKFNAKYADALKAKGYTVSEAVNGLVTVTK